MVSAALGRALTFLTQRTASVGGAGAAVRSMASATTAPHFNTKAINRAKEQAALRGRPDPFEGQPRVWYASIKNNDTSVWKLNLVARLIRGMPVNDAIDQMTFSSKKAATFVLRGIHSARSYAKRDGVPDMSQLWVKESYCGKAHGTKGIRYHGRSRAGRTTHPKTHYYIKLQEGKPPSKKTQRLTREQFEKRQREKLLRKPPRVRHSLETY